MKGVTRAIYTPDVEVAVNTPTTRLVTLLTLIVLSPACDHVTDISEYILRHGEGSIPYGSSDRRDPVDYSGLDGATFRGCTWGRSIADRAARAWNGGALCYMAAGVWLDERGALRSARDFPEWQFEYFTEDGTLLTVWVDWSGNATTKSWRTDGRFFGGLPEFTDGQIEAWMRTARSDYFSYAGRGSCRYQLFLWALNGNRRGQLQFYSGRDPGRMLGYITFDLDSGRLVERFRE
jgi:hypothetical protein